MKKVWEKFFVSSIMKRINVRGEEKMNEEELNGKKILTANQMTGELLLGIVLYGVISYVICRIAYGLTVHFLEDNKNYILLGFIVLVIQALMVFVTFKLANKQAFKKGTIYKNDVGNVIKNVSFVVIIILLIQVLGTFANVSSTVDEAVQDDFGLKYREHLMSIIYDDDDMAVYQAEKEKAIQEVKNKLYQYLAVVEVGIIVIYGTAIFLEKKSIYQRAE